MANEDKEGMKLTIEQLKELAQIAKAENLTVKEVLDLKKLAKGN